jgi:hypothetical protein
MILPHGFGRLSLAERPTKAALTLNSVASELLRAWRDFVPRGSRIFSFLSGYGVHLILFCSGGVFLPFSCEKQSKNVGIESPPV